MKLTPFLSAVVLVLSPTANSLKCWISTSDNPQPQKYNYDLPDGFTCVRFKYVCNAGEITMKQSACFGKTAGFAIFNYVPMDSASVTGMKNAPQYYQDLFVCDSSDFCNAPIGAPTSSPPVTPPPLPPTRPVKCWVSTNNNTQEPIQYPIQFPAGNSCARFKYVCNADEVTMQQSACYRKSAGYSTTYYLSMSSTDIDFARRAQNVYQDLFICEAPDYCNAPPSVSSPTPSAAPLATHVKENTVVLKSGEFISYSAHPSIGLVLCLLALVNLL